MKTAIYRLYPDGLNIYYLNITDDKIEKIFKISLEYNKGNRVYISRKFFLDPNTNSMYDKTLDKLGKEIKRLLIHRLFT